MKTIDVIKVMLSEGMSVSTQPINEQLGKFFTDVAVKATVDAARLELKNLVSKNPNLNFLVAPIPQIKDSNFKLMISATFFSI